MIQKETKLSTGATVSVNNDRVRVDLPPSNSSYQSISSAILNGGCQVFETSSLTHVINYKVPSTYDGLNPSPQRLLANFAKKEQINHCNNTVGMLTAASMETFAHSSRSATGISIDVIVTAGLSNSRSAGADADFFMIREEYTTTDIDTFDERQKQQMMKPGTINTIIVVNAPLTQGAQVEAYAIAIEAKCNACVDHNVTCAKDATKLAMGTGTDCTVLISHKAVPNCGQKVVKYAGKHTIFAEMIGQAVYEATSKAIMTNILYLHYNYATYTIHRWFRTFLGLLMGAMPLIPPKPMMPIPRAPLNVVFMGVAKVLIIYFFVPLPDKAKLLFAAVAWDRYLREPPLTFHPVCIAGSMISACLSRTPDRVYNNPLLGFTCGSVLLIFMFFTMTLGAWAFNECVDVISMQVPSLAREYMKGYYNASIDVASNLLAWILKLLLLKSTFSLQLLCILPLQMAKFIERGQIDDARDQLCWLCSRDPSKLGPSDLAGATLESLSENLSDGFVAPLFWYVLFGPIGALGYRVINTLDSRVGYRGKYEWFGKPSARLDDVINYIPARITTLLLALSASVTIGRKRAWKGLQNAWKDQHQCESPNAGWPMACFAGLLGVKLNKEGVYCLGASGKEPAPVDIRAGHRVAEVAGGITLVIAVVAVMM
ncbi:hypothetical protein ACHAWT_005776 [Skeletonema menzelii]